MGLRRQRERARRALIDRADRDLERGQPALMHLPVPSAVPSFRNTWGATATGVPGGVAGVVSMTLLPRNAATFSWPAFSAQVPPHTSSAWSTVAFAGRRSCASERSRRQSPVVPNGHDGVSRNGGLGV